MGLAGQRVSLGSCRPHSSYQAARGLQLASAGPGEEAATATESEPLTTAFAAKFLADLAKKIEARDVDAMVALCSDDVVYQDAGPSSQIDREEMRRMWTPVFGAMEHAGATVLDSFVGVEGDTVAAHWKLTFRRRDISEPIEIETFAIYAFRGGMIRRWTTIFRNFDWMGDVWP